MSLRPYGMLLRTCSRQVNASRTVFVLSSERKRRTKANVEKVQRWAERGDARKASQERTHFFQSMKELRNLTNGMSNNSNGQEVLNSEATDVDPLPNQKVPEYHISKENPQISNTGKPSHSSNFDPKGLSLLTPAVEIPASIQEKIGPAVKYLVTKEHQNWGIALKQIEYSGGFQGISEVDIRKLVYNIPKNQLIIVFPQIEHLLQEAGIQKSPKVVNAYLKSLIAGGCINKDRVELMEQYVSDLRMSAKKGKLSRETYEILIEAYGKCRRVQKMEEVINEMKKFGLQPTSNVYTSVLNTCVYKTRDHKQAVQIFDSMKFLAGNMAPGEMQYQDIIVSYVINNDIERALDLYEEMLSKGVPLNQKILVALAKGCMTRTSLRLKAWDFIFDIYKSNWEPTVPTLEYMIYLAAKDGDLSLSRALYQQLNLSGAVSPRSFGFLMLAYANSSLTQTLQKYFVPSVSVHESGRNFRRNILERTNYTPQLNNPKQAVPFLPILSVRSASELLSESSAVMAHCLLVNPKLLSEESVNMFLNIASKIGSLKEFIDRYDQFTFFDDTGVPETRIDTGSTELEKPEWKDASSNYRIATNYTKSPILSMETKGVGNFRIPRTTKTYAIALRAASRNKDYDFSQQIWQERGLYRRSHAFRNLSPQERTKADFEFAATMVNCLSDMALLDDALAILVSTEYQFRWTWKELKPLYTAAINVGYDKVSKTVRGVANRAQEKFEGKIRRKDFKKYVSERGY